ncbi:hypothetical protein MLD38_021404 [Melastoma candidum]|uniref:Uncharacterized protein n=1 Tax=Melastoma candidum TaxID=119954 RepID=A0ACB9QJU9_9MYRT|nr:hypothetical protein MLD38_021404 [Melastoma candidum]
MMLYQGASCRIVGLITIHVRCKSIASLLCIFSGEVQKDQAAQLLGMRPCVFRPKHSSKLGNEFRLFTNYNPGMRLGGWELEK